MDPQLPYSIVTGASRGLGKALAYELASRGKHLILAFIMPGEGFGTTGP